MVRSPVRVAGGGAVAHGDPLPRVGCGGEVETTDDQVYAAGHAGAHDPVQLGPLGGGQLGRAGRVGEQHDDPPRLGRGPAVAAVSSASDAYSPASTVSLTRQMCSTRSSSIALEPARPDEGEPERRERGQRAAELLRVVDGELDLARPGGAERAQQQPGDHPVHRGPVAGQVAGARASSSGTRPGMDVDSKVMVPIRSSPGRPPRSGSVGDHIRQDGAGGARRAQRGQRPGVAGQRGRPRPGTGAATSARAASRASASWFRQVGVRVPDQPSPRLRLGPRASRPPPAPPGRCRAPRPAPAGRRRPARCGGYPQHPRSPHGGF